MRSSVLCRQVDYVKVLEAVGVTPLSAALPTRVDCPICHKVRTLSVMTDIATNGQWAYCRSCQFAGDMILLAASAWKLETYETIVKLGTTKALQLAYCTDSMIETYTKIFANPFKKITSFWQQAQKCHVSPATTKMRELQSAFGVNLTGPDWNARAGQFIGSCTRLEYDSAIQYGSDTTTETKQNTRLRTMLDGTWTDLLVIPFWDMPGRMSGLLIIGRDGKPHKDYVYKKMIREVNEPGIAMLPALLRGKDPTFGHTKFVFTNIPAAIRLHAKHSRDHIDVLPLGATWDDPKHPGSHVWSTFSHKNMIFWGTDLVATIKQARLADGQVSTLEVTSDPFGTFFKQGTAAEWLHKIKKVAMSWVTVLQDHIIDMSDESANEVLARVGLEGRELSTFIEGCPIVLRDRLRTVTSSRVFESRIKFQEHWICERADGWYIEKTNVRICSAIVRIEQSISGVTVSYYKGYIKFRGVEYPFTAPVDVLEKGLLTWVQKYLRDKCNAGVCEIHTSWIKTALQLAIAFHSPQPVIGVDGIGWDQYNRQFNFPKFKIKIGGDVDTDVFDVFGDTTVPARRISQPMFLLPQQIEKLNNQTTESDIFWSVTAAIIANILAPAVNKNRLPLLLCGAGAIGIGYDTAAKHGCINLTDYNRFQFPNRLPVPEWSQNWPIMIRPQVPHANYDWFDDVTSSHFILNVLPIAAFVHLIRGRVNMVRYNRNLGSLQTLRDVADKVIANYLQYACQHKLLTYDHRTDLPLEVLHDLATWFSSIGGDPQVIRNARSLLHTPSQYPCSKYFCELVFELHRSGGLKSGQYGFWNNAVAPGICTLPDNAGVWVSQARLCSAIDYDCGMSPDLLLITNSLVEQGVLKNETQLYGDTGWVIDPDWWFANFSTWRADVSCNNGSGTKLHNPVA